MSGIKLFAKNKWKKWLLVTFIVLYVIPACYRTICIYVPYYTYHDKQSGLTVDVHKGESLLCAWLPTFNWFNSINLSVVVTDKKGNSKRFDAVCDSIDLIPQSGLSDSDFTVTKKENFYLIKINREYFEFNEKMSRDKSKELSASQAPLQIAARLSPS